MVRLRILGGGFGLDASVRVEAPDPPGRTALRLSALEFLDRLAKILPPPQIHRHRYPSTPSTIPAKTAYSLGFFPTLRRLLSVSPPGFAAFLNTIGAQRPGSTFLQPLRAIHV